MTFRQSSVSVRGLLPLLVCSAIAACGDDDPSPPSDAGSDAADAGADVGVDGGGEGDSGLDEDGCRVLTLGPRDFQFNLFGQLTGLRYPVVPNLDETAADFLLLELYDSTTEGVPALQVGTFDLAAPGNDNLGTCQHCLWVRVDETPEGVVPAVYYQTEGSITLDVVTDPLEPIFAGSTGRVVLRRATVNEEGHSVLAPEGDCVSLPPLYFDTSPTPNAPCLSAEHCGNALLEICDPDSGRCGEPQCGEFLSCPRDGQTCVSQYRDLFHGACYTSCDPSVSPSDCGGEQRCVQFGVDPSYGLCKTVGEGRLGERCEITDNGTSCAGTAVCSELSGTCTLSCDFYAATPGCGDGALCSLFGVCEPSASGRDTALGEPCGEADELATGCAPDGEAFRGICFAYPPAPPICQRACLGERGCDEGEFCALRFTSGLGVCLPIPVCGDGALGEVNESCDDGNTESGDGCSADCQNVEYEILCESPPGLPFGVEIEGDTSNARDGFQSSCQAGRARADLFTVTPPGPGRLTLQLASASNQTLALRAACADVATEILCAERAAGGEAEEIVHQVTSTTGLALTVVVSAFTVLEEGPFAVRADFVAELCGDGVVAGAEICDDGNTVSEDGCRGDCREVEYDFYCAQAQSLSTSSANAGDTTGAPNLFANECFEPGRPSGPDHIYHFVAPADGQLHLFLESPELMAVAVLDGCAPPSAVAELACNASFTLGTIDFDMTAGQAVTVLVDGFRPGDEGAYTLHATFTSN